MSTAKERVATFFGAGDRPLADDPTWLARIVVLTPVFVIIVVANLFRLPFWETLLVELGLGLLLGLTIRLYRRARTRS